MTAAVAGSGKSNLIGAPALDFAPSALTRTGKEEEGKDEGKEEDGRVPEEELTPCLGKGLTAHFVATMQAATRRRIGRRFGLIGRRHRNKGELMRRIGHEPQRFGDLGRMASLLRRKSLGQRGHSLRFFRAKAKQPDRHRATPVQDQRQ